MQRQAHSKSKWLYLSILALTLAIFGLVHHRFLTEGGWFNWEQFWHHESLIAMAFVAGISFMVVHLAKGGFDKRHEGKNKPRS